MKGTELIQYEFDNWEDTRANAMCMTKIGVFIANKEKHLSSQGVCEEWIKENLKNKSMYLGWDGNIYPKFEIKSIDID